MFRKSKNVLKFITPANSFDARWREGLPTGNGTVGVNVLGSASREVIVINHADLWWQGNTGVLPDVSDKIKNINKNLEVSSYREAETVLTNASKDLSSERADVSNSAEASTLSLTDSLLTPVLQPVKSSAVTIITEIIIGKIRFIIFKISLFIVQNPI
jgi:hypothetical protein